jgi:hypothetical protein
MLAPTKEARMDEADVRRWWSELSKRDRAALRIPRPRLMARFVEVDPEDDETDLYEWIVGHDLSFIQPRAFHICTRHVFIELAPSFACPFAESRCPMRTMLHACPNRKIRFVR